MKTYRDAHILSRLYIEGKKSVAEVAAVLGCSEKQVDYWLNKHGITKRSLSEAIYVKNNPEGDPFYFVEPLTPHQKELFGLGMGLYWGEGNKMNKTSVRFCNSDPRLIKTFIEFLEQIFMVSRKDMRFQLQIYDDVSVTAAVAQWSKKLDIGLHQWAKPFIVRSTKSGTYRHKSQYGVVTLSYHNIKLKNLLVFLLEELASGKDSKSLAFTNIILQNVS